MNEEDVDRMLDEQDMLYDDYNNRVKLTGTWENTYPNAFKSEPTLEERKVLALESIARYLEKLVDIKENEVYSQSIDESMKIWGCDI